MTETTGTFVIAEVAQAHDGSLGMLHSYIDAVASTGADAIKFQTHVADAESSPFEQFRVRFSYEDATRQDYWRRMELTIEQWAKLKEHSEAAGLEFISTPSSITAVELLERLGVRRYKVGSGDTDNRLLLHRVAQTGKPILLSTGLSTLEDIESSVQFLSDFGNQIVVMHCTSAYPAPAETIRLRDIGTLRDRLSRPIGFSDHSGTIYPSLAAVALGAVCIETHVVFDRRMFGPDAAASLTIDEQKSLVSGIRFIERALHPDVTRPHTDDFRRMRTLFGKTLSVRRNMKTGDTVTIDDLETKKPGGMGIPALDYVQVLGRRLRRDMAQWEFLRDGDLW